MNEINDWFDNADYEEGMNLFEQYGNNSALLSFFRMGENDFTRDKLFDELKKLAPVSKPEKPTFSKPPPADHGGTDDEISGTDPELRQIYRERANAHAQMKVQSAPSERKRCAVRILALTDRVEAKLNPVQTENTGLPDNPVELINIRNNNRAYISKNKNNVKRQGEVGRRMAINEIIEKKLANGTI